MAYTDPLNPSEPSDNTGIGGVPLPVQKPARVIEPDVPVRRPGSWDDILSESAKGAEAKPVDHGHPQLHLRSTTHPGTTGPKKEQPAKVTKPEPTKPKVPEAPPEPYQGDQENTAFSEEPLDMFDAAKITPAHETTQEYVDKEPSTVSAQAEKEHEESVTNTQTGDPSNGEPPMPEEIHERELEETISARFVRYGKTAVTSLVLPVLKSSSWVTVNMLKRGIGNEYDSTQGTEAQPETPAPPLASPEAKWSGIHEDEGIIDRAVRVLGVSKQEASAKLRVAVAAANESLGANAQDQPGTTVASDDVARVVDHNPQTNEDDDFGVYVEITGGRALSINPDDVLAVLGAYIS